MTQANVLAQLGAQSGPTFRNRIINGAMVIDQRNAGASFTQTNGINYTLDRWACYGPVPSKFTVQQNAGSITPPAGFVNYLGVTSLSAYSVPAGEIYRVAQPIEGYNIADLNWGSANAKTVTLSFWVRSSLTGTFGGALVNADATYNYPFAYTISAANTWQPISITITGATSGTWNTTNGIGTNVVFGMGVGSTYSAAAGAWTTTAINSCTGATSVVGTNGATFYITGVQLELGVTATSFDYRAYGQEFALCQRYFTGVGWGNMGICVGGTNIWNIASQFQVTMRAAPTLYGYTGTLGTTNSMTDSYAQDYIITAVGTLSNVGTTGARSSGWTTNNNGSSGRVAMWNTGSAVIQFSAEL